MPKRAYPFEETFHPQYKIRIDDKYAESNNQNSMNKIYSKTLDLLFKGAKSKKCDDSIKYDNIRDVFYDCNICKSTSIATSNCWFCENKLCQSCERKCSNCNEIFCSSCCIDMYNESVQVTCLNCVGN